MLRKAQISKVQAPTCFGLLLGPVRQAGRRVKYRQSALFVMSQHFGRIGAMVNGRVPYDAKSALENAEVVADMAKLPWAGFVPRHRGRQKAKAEIWKEQAKFKEHNEKLIGETGKLVAAAKTNNLDNLKTAFGHGGGLQGLPRQLPEQLTVGPARPLGQERRSCRKAPRFGAFRWMGPQASASSFSINWCNSAKSGSPT
jgi:cytochrome c556